MEEEGPQNPMPPRNVRGPYKRYLQTVQSDESGPSESTHIKIPRTTAWRLKKKMSQGKSSHGVPPLSVEGDPLYADFPSEDVECEADNQEPVDFPDPLLEDNGDNHRLPDADIRINNQRPYDSSDSDDSDDSIIDVGDESQPYFVYADSFGELHSAIHKDFGVPIGQGTSVAGRNIQVTATAGEVLQIMLAIASKHNFSNQALLDTINAVNTCLSENVLPHSQFGLDKLLFNPANFRYFFYCMKCEDFLEEKDEKISDVKCRACNFINPVNNLSFNNHFVMVDIKHQVELILLDETLISKEELTSRYASDDSSLRDIYDGWMYKKYFQTHVLNSDPSEIHISLSFCVDGSPLYDSSNTSVWPIIGIVNELSPKSRLKLVILIGLWYGSKKAKMDVLLEQFSLASKKNEVEGISISYRGRLCKLKIHSLACCVDSGARGSVQGVSQHNGTCACNWCRQNGIEVDNATRYPVLNVGVVTERSPEQHREDSRQLVEALRSGGKIDVPLLLRTGGVRSVTPLMSIPSFDIINGMIVDYMHGSLLGVARFFLNIWLEETKHASYIGDPNSLRLLNDKIHKITRCTEMRRPPRGVDDKAHWKAREFENWTLFYSVSVLKGILDDRFLKHWVLFVQALHILLQTSITEAHLGVAESLLNTFLNDAEKLYGINYMTFNLHIHKHLIDNVRRWGPLWAVNAFCFESYLGWLKRKVHANKGIQNQINRAISHQSAMKIIENSIRMSRKCKSFLATLRSYKSRNTLPDVERNGVKLYNRKHRAEFSIEEEWLMSNEGIESNSESLHEYGKAILATSSCVVKPYRTGSGVRLRNDTFQLHDGKIVQIEKIVDVESMSRTFGFARNVHTQPYMPQLYRQLARENATAIKIAVHTEESLIIVPLDAVRTVCYRSVDAACEDVVIPVPNLYNNV